MNKRTSSDSPLNLAYLIATQIALIVGISPSANARERFNPAHLETGAGGLYHHRSLRLRGAWRAAARTLQGGYLCQ